MGQLLDVALPRLAGRGASILHARESDVLSDPNMAMMLRSATAAQPEMHEAMVGRMRFLSMHVGCRAAAGGSSESK